MSDRPVISRGVPKERQLSELLEDINRLRGIVETGKLLQGPLHLASPLRIGDVIIATEPSPDDPNRIDLTVQNARTMNDPIVIISIP